MTVWGEREMREMRVQRVRGGFTPAAEYKDASAKGVSPNLSTLTGRNRTLIHEAKTDLKHTQL